MRRMISRRLRGRGTRQKSGSEPILPSYPTFRLGGFDPVLWSVLCDLDSGPRFLVHMHSSGWPSVTIPVGWRCGEPQREPNPRPNEFSPSDFVHVVRGGCPLLSHAQQSHRKQNGQGYTHWTHPKDTCLHNKPPVLQGKQPLVSVTKAN